MDIIDEYNYCRRFPVTCKIISWNFRHDYVDYGKPNSVYTVYTLYTFGPNE